MQYGGHLHPYAHASLLAENVNSLSLCKLNLRPKKPEGCQPAYQTTRLPLYDTNGSCTPHLNFSFILSVFAHVVSLHHLRVRIPVHNLNFVIAVLHPDDKGAEVLQWVSQRPTK